MTRAKAFVSTLPILVALGGCGSSSNDTSSGTSGDTVADGGLQVALCAEDKTAQPFSAGMSQKDTNGDSVAIVSDPPVPTSHGDHSKWTLTVTDSTGAPVADGTTVSVTCLMTHVGFSHGCPANITVHAMGGGVYEASPVIFNMPGHWQVDFQIGAGTDVASRVSFQLCLE